MTRRAGGQQGRRGDHGHGAGGEAVGGVSGHVLGALQRRMAAGYDMTLKAPCRNK